MIFSRRWLLIFCALILGGGQLFAAPSRETRAYATAVADFQSGMWSHAEGAFAQFVQRYPASTNAPQAVLLEAQAQFKQGRFTNAVTLLTARKGQAGPLVDQYASWIGEAQFAGGNFPAAADAFISLVNDFPESPLRLRAAVEAATAYDRGENWQQVISFLAQTNGVFQQKADMDPQNELVVAGRLLMARAWSKLNEPDKSQTILSPMNSKSLNPKQDAQWNQISYDDSLLNTNFDDALLAATNLIQVARAQKDNVLGADGWARMAGAFALSGQPAAAMTAWSENLAAGAPAEKQREAILKMAELAVQLKQFSGAEQSLENFLGQFPDSPQTDLALLTCGELHLQDYDTQAATSQLSAAQAKFDVLVANYPGSPLAGKALLDRGWCEWLATNYSGSLADFKAAAQKNLSAEDRAVAKFKAGDTLFALKKFEEARDDYGQVFPDALSDGSGNRPLAERRLAGQAMYQTLRACLELNDAAGATNAFAKLFQLFSEDEMGQGSALLYGESIVKPEEARSLFEQLAPKFSGSPLEPELKLAIARTYEQEQDWATAVTSYEGWVRDYPTNSLRPQADYALARANSQAGNEAVALGLFTHFVVQYPTNLLAPQAQWWVAEHFFRTNDYTVAETNYEAVYQTAAWKSSPLIYPAQLMAGRAAMGRQDFSAAVKYYFSPLIGDTTNCPADSPVGAQARFACAAALMAINSSDTNATILNLQTATNLLGQIIDKNPKNPTNELGALAWGEIGDCARQLGDYVAATNAYAQVYGTNSMANISARSRAQVGLGLVLEQMAAQTSGADKTDLLNLALDNYLQVFNGENMGEETEPDVWWVKESGLHAALLIGLLDKYETQTNFYGHLKVQFPQLADQIDKKVAALPSQKN